MTFYIFNLVPYKLTSDNHCTFSRKTKSLLTVSIPSITTTATLVLNPAQYHAENGATDYNNLKHLM